MVQAAKIQSKDVVTPVVRELLHLVRERMRFDERHAFDRVFGQPFAGATSWKRSRHHTASSADSDFGM